MKYSNILPNIFPNIFPNKLIENYSGLNIINMKSKIDDYYKSKIQLQSLDTSVFSIFIKDILIAQQKEIDVYSNILLAAQGKYSENPYIKPTIDKAYNAYQVVYNLTQTEKNDKIIPEAIAILKQECDALDALIKIYPTSKSQQIASEVKSIKDDETAHQFIDALWSTNIAASSGNSQTQLMNLKDNIDLNFYKDESIRIKDIIENTQNIKDKYRFIKMLIKLYKNKDTGYIPWLQNKIDGIDKVVKSLQKLEDKTGSSEFDIIINNIETTSSKYDYLLQTVEENYINYLLEAEEIEEEFKREAAIRRAKHLAKMKNEVDNAQCTSYSYKEFCEKSTDSCTWLGNSCKRFEKNHFPQP